MRHTTRIAFAAYTLLFAAVTSADPNSRNAPVEQLLDRFHRAAAEADAGLYFDLFTEDAVFLGTDATERWPMAEFRAFAEPRFAEGRGWTYKATQRHITLAPDGQTGWFDELLTNERLGQCRGSGAVVKTATGWKVAQYNLSIPIPNPLADEVVLRIRQPSDE